MYAIAIISFVQYSNISSSSSSSSNSSSNSKELYVFLYTYTVTTNHSLSSWGPTLFLFVAVCGLEPDPVLVLYYSQRNYTLCTYTYM